MSFDFQWTAFLFLKKQGKKTLNIEFQVVSTHAVKIWDRLNENCSGD